MRIFVILCNQAALRLEAFKSSGESNVESKNSPKTTKKYRDHLALDTKACHHVDCDERSPTETPLGAQIQRTVLDYFGSFLSNLLAMAC